MEPFLLLKDIQDWPATNTLYMQDMHLWLVDVNKQFIAFTTSAGTM